MGHVVLAGLSFTSTLVKIMLSGLSLWLMTDILLACLPYILGGGNYVDAPGLLLGTCIVPAPILLLADILLALL